ncbi:MAG: xanthine dehydrogenase family protein subunit M [Gammaproteobacteria bacterium]|nr:xanthine dehydrogenase family protein subunit M [Gammaproteobacteria bacterium]
MSSYEIPENLEQAIKLADDGDWRLLAGGTDFYPQLGDKPVDFNIIDINQIQELKGISREAEFWRIGATTTWSELLETQLPSAFDGLKLAAREVGSEQIQNAASVAGNLCNASPAADSVPPFLSLDAIVELQSIEGTRQMPVSEFIEGNRRTGIRQNEILTAVLVPTDRDQASSHFIKLGTRKYLVISISMVSALLRKSADGLIDLACISVGSCSEVAQRLPQLEADLIGKSVKTDLGDYVMPEYLSGLAPINDVRASGDYRMHASEELVRRVLSECEFGKNES